MLRKKVADFVAEWRIDLLMRSCFLRKEEMSEVRIVQLEMEVTVWRQF